MVEEILLIYYRFFAYIYIYMFLQLPVDVTKEPDFTDHTLKVEYVRFVWVCVDACAFFVLFFVVCFCVTASLCVCLCAFVFSAVMMCTGTNCAWTW